MNGPFRERGTDNPPKGPCLSVPHVHCDFCEHVIAIENRELEAARDILVHIRDDHNDEWMNDPEIRAEAPYFGVESL